MRAEPVRRSRVPAYPTKPEVIADPGILERHVPAAWRATEDVAKALTVFLAAGLAGCEGARPAPGAAEAVADREAGVEQAQVAPGTEVDVSRASMGKEPEPEPEAAAEGPTLPPGEERDPFGFVPQEEAPIAEGAPRPAEEDGAPEAGEPSQAIVAPLFEHGEGRGATGCVVVSPPVFLSEEEALQVITEELAKSGVEVPVRNAVLGEVRVSPRVYERESGEPREKARLVEDAEAAKPLEVDATDAAVRVAVEFVSMEDYDTLGGANPGRGRIVSRSVVKEDGTVTGYGGGSWGSTVSRYDFKDAAAWVSKSVERQGPGVYFGAFYDPMSYVDRAWPTNWKDMSKEERDSFREKAKAEVAARSRDLLREQVKGFVEWLKGQGVI